jgi:rhodanese-related sulfurtransferase
MKRYALMTGLVAAGLAAGTMDARAGGGGGAGCGAAAACSAASKQCAAPVAAGTIDAKVLKQRIDDKETITIVDARTAKYDDGNRIPGALHVPSDATDEQIAGALPEKDAAIVAYCSNTKCGASKALTKRLNDLGYVNVVVLPEGIAGWQEAGLPVEHTGDKTTM